MTWGWREGYDSVTEADGDEETTGLLTTDHETTGPRDYGTTGPLTTDGGGDTLGRGCGGHRKGARVEELWRRRFEQPPRPGGA